MRATASNILYIINGIGVLLGIYYIVKTQIKIEKKYLELKKERAKYED